MKSREIHICGGNDGGAEWKEALSTDAMWG